MRRTLDDISLLIKDLVKDGYILCEDKSYLRYLISIFNQNKMHWGNQLKKMPVLKFTPDEVTFIDEYLSIN